MTKAEMVRNYVASHPGVESGDVSDILGINHTVVCNALYAAVHRNPPLLKRVISRRSISGVPIYGYYGVDFPDDKIPVWVDMKEHVHNGIRVIENSAPLERKVAPLDEMTPANVPTQVGLDAIADEMADRLSDHLVAMFKSKVREKLAAALPDIIQSMPTPEDVIARLGPAHNKQQRKTVVLIAGLLPNQAGQISQEFSDVFDLRFFGSDENMKRLGQMIGGVDHVVIFTSKISHNVTDITSTSGKPVHHVGGGGMTRLRHILTDLYVTLSEKPPAVV